MKFARSSAVVAAAALFLAACTGDDSDASSSSSQTVGELTVPEVADGSASTLETDYDFELFDGTEVSLSSFAGRPVVVNVWAEWCPACLFEMPDFQKVHEEFGDDVVFIGVDREDSRERAVEFADGIGVTYLLADDPTGEQSVELGAIGMPHTVIFGPDGEPFDVHTGILSADGLREKINEALES